MFSSFTDVATLRLTNFDGVEIVKLFSNLGIHFQNGSIVDVKVIEIISPIEVLVVNDECKRLCS